jgi:site-specific DNA-cytosine methylase
MQLTLWFTKTRRAQNNQDYEAWQEGGVCPTLNAFDNHTETRATVVIEDPTVRRLTPLECERLQGFPDNWTEGQSDSQRYKQMGNAVAVPVVEWVIQGIVELER